MQNLVVLCSGFSARFILLFEPVKAGAADGCGDVVHAVVEADGFVEVFAGFAMGAEEGDFFGGGVAVGCDHATFAGAEVFGGVEGVGNSITKGTDAIVVVAGEVGLGSIVDDGEVVFGSDLLDGVDINGAAIEMCACDGSGFGGDAFFDICGIDLVGIRQDIAEDGDASRSDDHGCGGEEGPRGNDDFIARVEK